VDWVNLQGSTRLLRNHPGLLAFLADNTAEQNRVVENVRHFLRNAWESKDPRSRDWNLFSARYVYEKAHLKAAVIGGVQIDASDRLAAERATESLYPVEPPSNDPFHNAIYQLHITGAVKRLRKCSWRECPEKYFIRAANKTTKQPYCSTACHGYALTEIKRVWWVNNRGKGIRS
jgi:hypothetical protein